MTEQCADVTDIEFAKNVEKEPLDIPRDVSNEEYVNWSIGDCVGSSNRVITSILGSASSFVIYRVNDRKDPDFEHTLAQCPVLNLGISKYFEFVDDISNANIGLLRDDLYQQAVNCLTQMFRRSHLLNSSAQDSDSKIDAEQEVEKIYRPLSNQVDGAKAKVQEVLSFGPNYFIYIGPEGKINYICGPEIKETYKLSEAIFKFRVLEGLVDLLHNDLERKFATKQLGAALDMCIRSNQQTQEYDIEVIFEKAERFISSRQTSNIRAKFLKACFGFTLACVLLLLLISNVMLKEQDIFFNCMYFALVGSFVSVLQRHNSLTVDPFANSSSLFAEALCRMTVGMCFGLFVVFLSKSELALAPFKDLPNALITFAFISGFSERFIPDIVTSVSKANTK